MDGRSGQVQVVIYQDNTSITHKILSQLYMTCIHYAQHRPILCWTDISEQFLLRFRCYSTFITLSMGTPEHSDHTKPKKTSANNHLYEYTGIYPCPFVGFLKQLGALVRLSPMGNRGVIIDYVAWTQEHTSTHVFTLSDLVDPRSRRRQIGINECAAVCRKGCWMTLGDYDDAVGEMGVSLEARTA